MLPLAALSWPHIISVIQMHLYPEMINRRARDGDVLLAGVTGRGELGALPAAHRGLALPISTNDIGAR